MQWAINGSSMDYQWVINELSINHQWIINKSLIKSFNYYRFPKKN